MNASAANEPGAYTLRVRFPNARDVCVLGKFNNWSTVATPLRHVGGWVWEATLPLGADMRDVCFFVWRQGQRVGRLVRHAASANPILPAPPRPGQGA